MLKTQAIKDFLLTTGNPHLTSLYNEGMEVQVNVAKDGGERISDVYKGKRWSAWKGVDGTVWKSFRIPWGADSDPQYNDSELKFSLFEHAEAIGMTGWDWVNKQSLWVGFDFDSIANHKEGLSKEALNELVDKVSTVEWITLLKSTSGNGYHVYIHFDQPVKTANHTEHAAVARSLLGVLTLETGYNFTSNVDCCGGVLWCYHRKQEGTDGLTLINTGSKLPVNKIPCNWQEHINVTTKRAKKVKTRDSSLSELVAGQQFTILDEEHHRLLKWFSDKAERSFWWDQDHNMFVCHTLDIAKAYSELSLKGIFFTNSTGSSDQNCFMFPNINGSWVVRRHGIGTREHPSWVFDQSGWTRCVLNAPAELESAVKSNKGVRNAKGEYVFNNHKKGLAAIKQMSVNFDPPQMFLEGPERNMSVKSKGDVLIISIDRLANEGQPDGFLSNTKNDKWEAVLDMPKTKREFVAPDSLIRHAISQGVEAGWYIKTKNDWVLENKSNAFTVLVGQEEHDRNSIEILMGKCIVSPWKLVNYPFADEYPGDREWNKDCASLATKPEEGDCHSWLSVINHCGSNLNDSVKNDLWCQSNGIKTGGDYLLCWVASMIQKPTEPLPYLFFVGEQNTGKSTLHEALGAFILRKGYARADYALTNPSGFNAEIANSVLCVVEETDLRKNREAGNRIKDWVTGKTVSIRALYKNAYDIVNSTHWIQCANDANYCPVMPGDTRVVVTRVDKPTNEIPKQVLFQQLAKEAGCFLNLLFSVELPESPSRLAVPCLQTHEKTELEFDSKNDLERFVEEKCHVRKGCKISFEDFYGRFYEWLAPDSRSLWSSMKTSRCFPKTSIMCKGKFGADSTTYIGNLSLNCEDEHKNFVYKTNAFNGRLEEIVCKQ